MPTWAWVLLTVVVTYAVLQIVGFVVIARRLLSGKDFWR